MGTRSDYYIGIGPTAEWIGSTSYDGDPYGCGERPLRARSEKAFRAAVEALLADPTLLTTRPAEGWPWPWEDSRLTDFAYAWDPARGPVVSRFGCVWITSQQYENDFDATKLKADDLPDMSKGKKAGIWAKSGLLILR